MASGIEDGDKIRIGVIIVHRRRPIGGVPFPLLMDDFLVRPRISVDQPADGVR
jgi:hypothetical protein